MAKAAQKKTLGRPSKYTPELAEEICARLIAGESLRSICEDENFPDKATVLRWAAYDESFRDHYARAKLLSAESSADDVEHYARAAARGEIDPAAARTAIDGLKWSAGQRDAKKYGPKTQHEITGQVQHTIRPELPWESLSPETRALVMAELEAERARLAAPVEISEVDDEDG